MSVQYRERFRLEDSTVRVITIILWKMQCPIRYLVGVYGIDLIVNIEVCAQVEIAGGTMLDEDDLFELHADKIEHLANRLVQISKPSKDGTYSMNARWVRDPSKRPWPQWLAIVK